mgnify:CR=1 FL=1
MLTPVPLKRPKRCGALADEPTQEFAKVVVEPAARDLAEVLRRTTLRAHTALKDASRDPEGLQKVRAEVDGLRTEIERLGLGRLRPFLEALYRRLEGGGGTL